jgi:hypothetical protein
LTCALILLRVPADMCAQFICSMTEEWSDEQTTELISCLDCVLEWPEVYFQEFTLEMMTCMSKQEQSEKRCEKLLKSLTLMYENNLIETKLRLVSLEYSLELDHG